MELLFWSLMWQGLSLAPFEKLTVRAAPGAQKRNASKEKTESKLSQSGHAAQLAEL